MIKIKNTVMSRVILGGRVPTPNSLLLTTYYLLLITLNSYFSKTTLLFNFNVLKYIDYKYLLFRRFKYALYKYKR